MRLLVSTGYLCSTDWGKKYNELIVVSPGVVVGIGVDVLDMSINSVSLWTSCFQCTRLSLGFILVYLVGGIR